MPSPSLYLFIQHLDWPFCLRERKTKSFEVLLFFYLNFGNNFMHTHDELICRQDKPSNKHF
jgi:hypothetical protein